MSTPDDGATSTRVDDIAGFVIFRINPTTNHIEYLLLEKTTLPGHWSPPKGFVEAGEALLDAARRESQEEAGLLPEHYQILLDLHDYFEYVTNRGVPKRVNLWPAQMLRWDQPIVTSEEHRAYRWVDERHCVRTVSGPYRKSLARTIDSIGLHLSKKS